MSGRRLKPSLKYDDSSVPPVATLEGIDLVTEGVLTLNKCWEKITDYKLSRKLENRCDGATLLAKALLKADRIRFLVGTAVNPAHEELMRSLQLKTRTEAVKRLGETLTQMGKEIVLEMY